MSTKYYRLSFGLLLLLILPILMGGCQKSEAEKAAERGKKYFLKGQYEDAAAEFRLSLKHGSKNAEILYMVGVCYAKMGRDEKSHQFFTEAIELDPKWKASVIPYYSEMAKKHRLHQNKTDLIKVLSWLLELDPTYDLEDNYYILADYYYQNKKYEHALSIYQQALYKMSQHPNEREARRRIIDCHMELGDYISVIRNCDEFLKQYPDTPIPDQNKLKWDKGQAAYQVAKQYLEQEIYDEAIEYASIVLDLQKPISIIDDAYFILGEAYTAKDEIDKAITYYEKIINNKHNRERMGKLVDDAQEQLKMLYMKKGRTLDTPDDGPESSL